MMDIWFISPYWVRISPSFITGMLKKRVLREYMIIVSSNYFHFYKTRNTYPHIWFSHIISRYFQFFENGAHLNYNYLSVKILSQLLYYLSSSCLPHEKLTFEICLNYCSFVYALVILLFINSLCSSSYCTPSALK